MSSAIQQTPKPQHSLASQHQSQASKQNQPSKHPSKSGSLQDSVLKPTEFSRESQLTIPESNLLQSYSTLLNIICLM